MKKILLILVFLLSVGVFAQNEQLAQNYFEKGEFEKALVIYQDLYKTNPNNTYFIQRIAASYQQLKQYDAAEKFLIERVEKLKQPQLYVELGYNYQLKKDQPKADKNYRIAIDAVTENPGNVYMVANSFEQKVLVEQAIKTYEAAQAANKSLNFDYQLALLQGQSGNIDLMIEKLLSYAYNNPQNLAVVQNQLTRFMNEESQETFNASLRKALLVQTQKTQDIFWNQFLSWFFVQQKDYGKAFIQEKAIFKRSPENFYSIVNLAHYAYIEGEDDTAKEIFAFILQNTQDPNLQVQAHHYLLEIDISKAQEKDYPAIKQRMEALLQQYGSTPNTLDLQMQLARFEAFT